MLRASLMAASVLAGAMLTVAAPAHAGYGAIAYDKATNRYGFAWNEATQARANELAKKDCGSDACSLVPVPPAQCGALATTEDRKNSNAWGASVRPSKGDAEARAIADCQKHTKGRCNLRGSECNR